ncbi:MAG: polysaccharide biosynthesis tyrosine autokinase [Armatimonadetes bacterium]|nr:polysaccharide biosynthesis tyrosine autokinase [Armatimonadota bacterium]MDW8122896.1 polysaccharide biosynthesis tyrosine autokinase [Armatimonadota bacterium]
MDEMRGVERERGEESGNLQAYLFVPIKRWPLVATITAICLLLAVAYLRTATPIYQATSMIRVVSQPSLSLIPVEPQRGNQPTLDVGTAAQLATAYLTIREALKYVQTNAPNQMAPEVRNTLKNLKAEDLAGYISTRTQDPDIVRISVRHPSPEIAYLVANGIADALVKRLDDEARAEARAERIYIQGQIQRLQVQMEAVNSQLASLRQKVRVIDVDEEAKRLSESIEKLRLELQTQIALEDAALNAERNLRVWAGREAPILSVDVTVKDPIYEELKKRLAQLEVERAALLGRYQPNHPEVQRVEQSIQATLKAMDGQKSQYSRDRQVAPNPFYGPVRMQLIQLEQQAREAQARKEALQRLLQEAEARLAALPEMQKSLQNLIRQQMVLEQTYTNLLNRLYDAQIREAAKRGSVIVADRAFKPTRPVAPRKALILTLAVVLGLMLSLAVVFSVETLSISVEMPEDVRQITGVPVLAIVPLAKPAPAGAEILDFMTSRKAAAEAVRNLRTNIRFLSAKQPIRTLLVTSALAREGKSFLATCLAIAYAQSGQPVVLIDADMRQPTIDKTMGLTRTVGLSSVLLGQATLKEALQRTSLEPLKVLTAGPTPPQPAELLESPRLRNLLKSAELEGHIVIIDSPPVLLVADPSVLAPLTDGVLLVVQAGRTPKEALARAQEQLSLTGARLIGAVLNQVSPRTGRGYYYYRYYYYYYRYY